MINKTTGYGLLAPFLLFLGLAFFSPALAEEEDDLISLEGENETVENLTQDDLSYESSTDFDESVEEMKVTGSRIRRIDMESPNPITVWTKEDLENKGYFNVSDFFINSPISNFGSLRVHNRNTLQLINGARINFDTIHSGGNGLKKVIDFLPIAAIERVEILKGASSALYGSDVTGGVVNIITKKWTNRPEISFKISPALYPFYKGGDQAEASFTFGKKFSQGNFISAWQFQWGRRLKVSERSEDWAFVLYPLNKESASGCPADSELFIKAGTPEALKCYFNLRQYAYFPSAYDMSAYNYGEWRMNSRITFYGQLFGFGNMLVYPSVPSLGMLEIKEDDEESFLFKDNLEKEKRRGLFVDGTAGIKGWMSKTWDFDFSLKWSGMWDKTSYQNALLEESLIQALTPAGYNIFDPNFNLGAVGRHTAFTKNHDSKIYSSLDFSGKAFGWDTAFGAQAWHNRYTHYADQTTEEGKVFAHKPAGRSSGKLATRTVLAAYTEGVKNLFDVLEFQFLGRLDHYSDYGLTANPALAFLYRPADNFLIRLSGGRSFEAPDLTALHSPLVEGEKLESIPDIVACYNELKAQGAFQAVFDSLSSSTDDEKDRMVREFLIEQNSVIENKALSEETKTAFQNLAKQQQDLGLPSTQNPNNGCNTGNYKVKGQFVGNKNLKEAVTYRTNLGFHWEPKEDHSLTVDGWMNWMSNLTDSWPIRNKTVFDAELRHGKSYVERYGVQYERQASPPHKIQNPVEKPINISKRYLYGIDAKWRSDFKNKGFKGGWFYFEDDLSWILGGAVENFPGMGFVSNIGKSRRSSRYPRWRNFASFGWRNERHDISILLKSVASVKKSENEFESLSISNIADLFYQYKMDEKTAIKAGWYNALFFGPVIDDTLPSGLKINTSFYDVRGPRFFVELRRVL